MAKKVSTGTTGSAITGFANVPGVPAISSNASGSITFTFSNNENSDKVEYAVYDNINDNYLKPDGTSNGASEDWNDYAAWDDGEVTVSSLTAYTSYTFKAKARNEADEETAFTADSLTMTTNPGLHYGETSDNLERTVTPSAVRITGTPEVSGSEADNSTTAAPSYYGSITLSYVLQRNAATENGIQVQFSEDYDPDAETGTWAAATVSGGDGATGLVGTTAGATKTIVWDSYTDAGGSELDASVTLRIRANDISPLSGDYSAWAYTTQFGVNNRPGKMTLVNGDTYSWGEDTTITVRAIFPPLRGGTANVGFPRIHIYKDEAGSELELTCDSILSIENWKYQSTPPTYIAMTVAGMPGAAADGTNLIEITVPAGSELEAGLKYINGEMGEVQEES